MKKLLKLHQKKKRLVAGIMSGTSVDGVDIVLVEISGSGTKTNLKQVGFIEYSFPEELRKLILKNSAGETSNVEDISTLNAVIPHLYASGLKCLCESLNIAVSAIDLIGTHGQTIQHLPDKKNYFGFNCGSTLQIGDPAILAKLTGVITVGDFRTGDMALGGEGAPLVPYFDYIMFRSAEKCRLLLNIGGISNFTVINKNASKNDIYAFDTGPGNMMIDLLMKKLYNRRYDKDGETASAGSVNKRLFEYLKGTDEYIEKTPPKSTGRELYNEKYLNEVFNKFGKINHEDWISTISYFTVYGIFRNYEKFVKQKAVVDEVIVSGGGAKNKFIMNSLQSLFGSKSRILNCDSLGINSDAKEAICFAVLANECINGNPTNIPRVTGADRETILGKICLP